MTDLLTANWIEEQAWHFKWPIIYDFAAAFGRIKKIIDLPYLIEIQKNSYDQFLQREVAPAQRQNFGLQEVFKSVFPIKDFNETASLEFVSYALGEPKYDVEECHQRGMTFAAPLKVTVQLVLWDVDAQTGARSIKNVKEQEVYFGEIPLMTKNGTFMVNGTERVIVSQLHRSPGVFFEHDKGKTHASGKLLYSARVIPYRGSWVDLEFDPRDILYVRIDRRRKFHATVLLRALGMTTEDLLNYYYRSDTIVFDGRKPALVFNPQHLLGAKVGSDVRDPKSNDLDRQGRQEVYPAGSPADGERPGSNMCRSLGKKFLGVLRPTILLILRRRKFWSSAIMRSRKKNSISFARKEFIRSRCCSSTIPRSGPICAILCCKIASDPPRMRSSRSIDGCGREIRRRSNRRLTFLTTFFSIRIATISPKSAGSN